MKRESQLRFPGFEGAWEICSMEKISEIKKGFTPRTDNDAYWKNGDIPWLSIADMNQGKFVKNSAKNITKEALGTKALVPKGTLIMSFKLSIGKLAILSEKMMTNEAICHFYWKNDDIITDYIYYYLNTVDISSFGGRAVKGVTLNSDALNSIVVKLPAYSEQQKIADCLTAMDDTIEDQQQKVEQLQSYKKGLLQQLFSQTLRFPGFEGEWEEKKLGEVTDIRTGNNDLQDKVDDGEYPFFVRSANIEHIDSYTYDGEAVLIPGDGNIGQIYHYINGRFAYHQRVYKISDFVDVTGKYIYYYMNEFFKKEALRNSVKATVDSLRLPTLTNFKVQTPSLPEQQKIADCLSTLDEVIELEQQKLEKLQVYKKGLLQQLFA